MLALGAEGPCRSCVEESGREGWRDGGECVCVGGSDPDYTVMDPNPCCKTEQVAYPTMYAPLLYPVHSDVFVPPLTGQPPYVSTHQLHASAAAARSPLASRGMPNSWARARAAVLPRAPASPAPASPLGLARRPAAREGPPPSRRPPAEVQAAVRRPALAVPAGSGSAAALLADGDAALRRAESLMPAGGGAIGGRGGMTVREGSGKEALELLSAARHLFRAAATAAAL